MKMDENSTNTGPRKLNAEYMKIKHFVNLTFKKIFQIFFLYIASK